VLGREVVRRHYEQYGPLLTRKQQPGVEYHLKVERASPELGEPGRHWGWQARWYEPDDFWQSGRLRQDQRREIEAAIEKTAEHVKGLTDWVLWTRDKLNADDSRWYEGLDAPFTLRRWDQETLIGMFSGSAEILRQTWFGELVLTSEKMCQLREEALAPVRSRYHEELHVRTPAEWQLEALLPGAGSRLQLAVHQRDVIGAAIRLESAQLEKRLGDEELKVIQEIEVTLAVARRRLSEVRRALSQKEIPSAQSVRLDEPSIDGDLRREVVVRLRQASQPELSDALSRGAMLLERARGFLEELATGLSTPLLVAVGGAGAGKTHLAAHVTGPDANPAGILVLGRQFGEEIRDDDLPRVVGLAQRSRDDLLEAIEATGARLGRRLPLIVDGLNESDNPLKWEDVLARLNTRLARLPHVMGIVTIRPSYVDVALPAGLPRIDLPGFEGVVEEAVRRYFDYYKIQADLGDLHWWPPSHPLLLAIFCRTVNPNRERQVSAGELPGSLPEVFETYLDGVYRRIARTLDMEIETVASASARLAERLFETGVRHLDRREAGALLGDGELPRRQDSLRFQLESEEVLSRDMIDGSEHVFWSYDLLAGHVIAKSILQRLPDPEQDLLDSEVFATLETHPLREDIVAGLSGLLGRRGIDMWRLVGDRDELFKMSALALPRLPPNAIGQGSEAAMRQAFERAPAETLDALAATAFTPGHPLNASVLDELLGELEVWQRDLTWTEWVRSRSSSIALQVQTFAEEWMSGGETSDDEAALVWLTWLLTTTDKRLRDEVTYALYHFGRRMPDRLFARALHMLGTNDAFIAEGLLAASYGAAMAALDPASDTSGAVVELAGDLDRLLLRQGAEQPSFHWLIREYAYRIAQLAAWLSGGAFAAPTSAPQPPLPQPAIGVGRFTPDSAGWESTEGAFAMDFSNYTIGLLIPDRGNYEDDHPRFLEVTGEIRWRVSDLGWSAERFEQVDREIAERNFTRDNDPRKVERYGKKYSWIGFYEAAGRLADGGELSVDDAENWRLSEMPIDPSFPEPAPPFAPPAWDLERYGSDEAWVRRGVVDIPDELLRPVALDGADGPWIAIDGFLRHQPDDSIRKVFCFIRGLIALEGWQSVESYLADHVVDNDLVPRNDTDYYSFAGEVPWSPTFHGTRTKADGSFEPSIANLGGWSHSGPKIELLAVDAGWESYHSDLNRPGYRAVPTKAFARFAELSPLPGGCELVDGSGFPAAKIFSLDFQNWGGHLLYVRQDVLERYCRDRQGEWGWVAWGERQLMPDGHRDYPRTSEWMGDIRRSGADRFHRIASLSEVDSA